MFLASHILIFYSLLSKLILASCSRIAWNRNHLNFESSSPQFETRFPFQWSFGWAPKLIRCVPKQCSKLDGCSDTIWQSDHDQIRRTDWILYQSPLKRVTGTRIDCPYAAVSFKQFKVILRRRIESMEAFYWQLLPKTWSFIASLNLIPAFLFSREQVSCFRAGSHL